VKATLTTELNSAKTEHEEQQKSDNELISIWRVKADVAFSNLTQEKKMNDQVAHVTMLRQEELAQRCEKVD
jgi:hypothetical protein